MTIYQRKEETLIKIYFCPICKKNYLSQTGPTRMSCAVMHYPGQCCHYAKKEISLEVVNKIYEVLSDEK